MIQYKNDDVEVFINPKHVLSAAFSFHLDEYNKNPKQLPTYYVELRFTGYQNPITFTFASEEQAEEVKAQLMKALKEN